MLVVKVSFALHFHLKKKIYKDYNVVYAGVCSKQACFTYNWRT